ncbi:MAG: hypothetical protein IPK12_23945 [Gemmatimonadetes bacterium]|nr:hypothetical protein [Gemmatimonadota bacterium]
MKLAERHELTVNISIASTDGELLRRLEARSPAPHARLRALARLTAAGIHAGMLIAPIIPGVTDSREALGALMQEGKAAGARFAVGSALRLGPAARSRFLPHLAHEFPELAPRYARRYAGRTSAGRDYTDALGARIRSLQQEHGFPVSRNRQREKELKGQANHTDNWRRSRSSGRYCEGAGRGVHRRGAEARRAAEDLRSEWGDRLKVSAVN